LPSAKVWRPQSASISRCGRVCGRGRSGSPGRIRLCNRGLFLGAWRDRLCAWPKQGAPTDIATPIGIRINARIDTMRRGLAERIRATLPGDTGGIAAALVTGIRDHISHDANEAMRISGLYHVISISGLHMALVAGVLFALIRGGLALVPRPRLRHPIKKYAALTALAGVTLYLLLSGAEVATQRSYIMIAIVLAGVLIDRPALTLRTLAAAVVVTLIISPEAVLNPGFQMSFAATLRSLVSTNAGHRLSPRHRRSAPRRWLRGRRAQENGCCLGRRHPSSRD
jgi:competence protein ComEC